MEPAEVRHTVTIRVQVIDLHAFTLDLTVPTYLPAKDLTQRIARDAGLGAYWPDGRRRRYWLRARGRLVGDDEKLGDIGVVDGELVYLLPEPPAGSGVVEQPPDYPETRGYAGKGTLALVGSILLVLAWTVAWGAALLVERTTATVLFPGLGLGFLCMSLARHLWGGDARRPRVAATALVLFLIVAAVVFLPSILAGESAAAVYSDSVGGFVAGFAGLFAGWLAWWGPVEPLPEAPRRDEQAAEEAVQAASCAICGAEVQPDVRADCPYGCGRAFHAGCYQARRAVYRGDPRFCPVCNARVG